MGDEPLPDLTPKEMSEAVAVYRQLQLWRRSGVRRVEIDLDDDWGMRTVGRRVNLSELTARVIVTAR